MRLPSQFDVQNKPFVAPRVLVSVLSYNSDCNLIATLRSLQQQTYPDYCLQLVNNASTTRLPEGVQQEFPAIHIQTFTENIGYTGGSNFALRQGATEGFDYILLCTHDIEVDKQAIEHLIQTAEREPDAGIVGGVEVRVSSSVSNSRRTAISTAAFSRWTARLRWMSHDALEHSSSEERSPSAAVPCVHGSLVLFTPRALSANIFMDENLFMYFDEVDIGFQLKAHGLQAYVDSRVAVRHNRAQSGFNSREGYLMQRNRAYTMRKYGRWYHRVFYNLYAALIELPAKLCWHSLQGYPGFAWACACGHLDALRGRMDRHLPPREVDSHPLS